MALVTGKPVYTDDLAPAGLSDRQDCFRSPHANAHDRRDQITSMRIEGSGY